jgi:hypothetical protein
LDEIVVKPSNAAPLSTAKVNSFRFPLDPTGHDAFYFTQTSVAQE